MKLVASGRAGYVHFTVQTKNAEEIAKRLKDYTIEQIADHRFIDGVTSTEAEPGELAAELAAIVPEAEVITIYVPIAYRYAIGGRNHD